jgi:hypothetical protein
MSQFYITERQRGYVISLHYAVINSNDQILHHVSFKVHPLEVLSPKIQPSLEARLKLFRNIKGM